MLAAHHLPAHGQCLNTGSFRQVAHFYVIAKNRLASRTDLEIGLRSPTDRLLDKRLVKRAEINQESKQYAST
jgi:hypothetical protein